MGSKWWAMYTGRCYRDSVPPIKFFDLNCAAGPVLNFPQIEEIIEMPGFCLRNCSRMPISETVKVSLTSLTLKPGAQFVLPDTLRWGEGGEYVYIIYYIIYYNYICM